MERYTRELARHELAERERLTRLDAKAAALDQIASEARSAAVARSDRIQLGLREGDPASIEEFAGYAIDGLALPDGFHLSEDRIP